MMKPKDSQNCWFNVLTVISWVLFSFFLLTQPWMANWVNNRYHAQFDKRTLYNITVGEHFSKSKYTLKYGLCTIPAADYICTDGANFTELALKYRPDYPFACGCGEGIYGEGLCPRTSYGYTLSDYVSSPPALGAMLGLSTFPLIGARQLTSTIIEAHGASKPVARILVGSLNSFQVNYILWGMASVCVFEAAHALLTMTFLGSYIVFALAVLYLFHQNENKKELNLDQWVIFVGAVISFLAISLGSIPRACLVIDGMLDKPMFPDMNQGGIGSYVFWLGEAVGLSVFFGLYPLVLLAKLYTGKASWTSGEGDDGLFEVVSESEYE